MAGRAPTPVTLTPRQQAVLERIIRRQTSSQQTVRRAHILLAAARDPQAKNEHLARRLQLNRNTVARWRLRWAAAASALAAVEEAHSDDHQLSELALALLADEPRPGAPGVFTPEQVVQIVAVACEEPQASDRPVSHWTPRELADEAQKRGIVERISSRTVGRFLKAGSPPAPPQPVLAQR